MDKKTESRIISGVMNWGEWGENLSVNEMAELIEFNLEKGINTFDQADIYGGYTTEKQFGKAFKSSGVERTKIKLITKCGIQYPCESKPFKIKHYDYSPQHIRFSVENSLKNLKTEYIDVFLLHRPSPLMNGNEIAEVISKLKNDRKIKEFGVSNFTESQIKLIKKNIPVDFNQIECSLTNNECFSNGIVDFCQTENINLMAWSPLGSYFKIKDNTTNRIKPIIEKLSNKYSCSVDQLLLSWIMKQPASIIPVIGTTKKERILASIKSINVNLDRLDWFSLLEASTGKRVA